MRFNFTAGIYQNKKKIVISVLLCLMIVGIYTLTVGQPLNYNKDISLSFDMDEDFKNILYYAAMAPSGHNTQPWKVQYNLQSDDFTLFFDNSRHLPQVDPRNREAFISLGAFLQNWKEAAPAYGYNASVTVFPQLTANSEVAHISLFPTGDIPADAEQYFSRLRNRHTDKRCYEARLIPESVIEEILDKNRPYLHFYPKGTREFEWLSKSTEEAMSGQMHHEGKRVELSHWMRFSNAEAYQARDGLPAEQLGLKGPIKALFYTFYNRESAAKESFALEAVKQTKQRLNSTAGFFVVTGSYDFTGTIEAGMHFEKFWLDATTLGISIQPMSQILEEEPFMNTVMGELNLDVPVQMIVRAGINSNYGQNNGVRRNISSFVTNQ